MTDVTLPTEVSSHTSNSKLNEQILKGEYNIGQLIVPQILKKPSIRDNSVVTEEFTLQGRKIALYNIRQKMFDDQKSYMRLHTDDEIASFDEKDLLNLLKERKDFSLENDKSLTKEELANQLKKYKRTKYLMFWHDGSSVSNHSPIMMMVSCTYDKGAFVTNAEHYAKHGFLRNEKSIIEKTYVYILARCPSDDHQLLYTQERVNNILELNRKITHNGISITDVCAFSKRITQPPSLRVGNRKTGIIYVGNTHCLLQYGPYNVSAKFLIFLSGTSREKNQFYLHVLN